MTGSTRPTVDLDVVLEQLANVIAERVARKLSTEARPRTPEPKQPDFESEINLAKRKGISPRTLQGWRLRGGGPPWSKVGRRVLYDRAAADAFFSTGK